MQITFISQEIMLKKQLKYFLKIQLLGLMQSLTSRIKKCKHQIAEPLKVIFRKSIQTGEIRVDWKLPHVISILKPGAHPSSPASYRQVSLTSHLVKTYERIITSNIQNHLKTYNRISETQNCFRSKRSYISQLLHHHDTILKGKV